MTPIFKNIKNYNKFLKEKETSKFFDLCNSISKKWSNRKHKRKHVKIRDIIYDCLKLLYPKDKQLLIIIMFIVLLVYVTVLMRNEVIENIKANTWHSLW